jgi:hypothetical protein
VGVISPVRTLQNCFVQNDVGLNGVAHWRVIPPSRKTGTQNSARDITMILQFGKKQKRKIVNDISGW